MRTRDRWPTIVGLPITERATKQIASNPVLLAIDRRFWPALILLAGSTLALADDPVPATLLAVLTEPAVMRSYGQLLCTS